MSSPSDLFDNIGAMREALETLLKRGKPVSVEDLQKLIATVEAKAQPQFQLPAADIAKLLAPAMLPLLPTPDNLVAAGQKAAGHIKAAIRVGTDENIDYLVARVQQGTEQLIGATATLRQAAAAVPKSVKVDFLQGWKTVSMVAFLPVLSVLLVLWMGGFFSRVSRAKYEEVLQEQHRVVGYNAQLLKEGKFYFEQVRRYVEQNPKAKAKFPKYIGPGVPTPQPISIMRSTGNDYELLSGL